VPQRMFNLPAAWEMSFEKIVDQQGVSLA